MRTNLRTVLRTFSSNPHHPNLIRCLWCALLDGHDHATESGIPIAIDGQTATAQHFMVIALDRCAAFSTDETIAGSENTATAMPA
ncbi:hypothetical protein ACWJKU_13295 [Methylocaldum sp. MU1018]